MSYDLWRGHLAHYGSTVTALLAENEHYSEAQCGACPYEHRCCDMAVSVTLFEAMGIAAEIRDKPDVIARVREQADAVAQHFTSWTDQAQFDSWYAKRRKCVFYSKDARPGGGCSIYAVRPVACRRAYGEGDCRDGAGVVTISEAPQVAVNRARRLRVPGAADSAAIGELATMVKYLLDDNPLEMDEALRAFLQVQPGLYPPPVVLAGPYGRAITFKFGA